MVNGQKVKGLSSQKLVTQETVLYSCWSVLHWDDSVLHWDDSVLHWDDLVLHWDDSVLHWDDGVLQCVRIVGKEERREQPSGHVDRIILRGRVL